MKQTLIVVAALLAVTTATSYAATAPKAPNGYVYLRDGKLVRFPGPGMIYDNNDNMIPRPFACAPGSSSSAPAAGGGKTSVGFPCDNIYGSLIQLPVGYVAPTN